MFNFLSFEYLSQFIIFLIGSFLAFYIPGNIFVRKLKMDRVVSLTLSFVLGVSLWALQGFIFGILNIRELTYLYLGVFVFYWFYININYFKNFNFTLPKKLDKQAILITTILIIGIFLQIISIIWNYIPINGELIFVSAVPDNLYHAAILRNLMINLPPLEPGVSNATIYNYHFLSNLIGADFSRVFNVNYMFLDFHYFVLLFSVLFGLSVYSFGKVLNIGKKYIIFLLLIIYFVGDLLPYLAFYANGNISVLNSTLESPLSLWISFSRYIGIVLFFGGLIPFIYWLKNRTKLAGIIAAVIFGSIIGFKVYIGVLALVGLLFLSLYFIYKKQYSDIFYFLIALLISILIYLPINNGAGVLVFTGFWRFEDFATQPHWGLSNLELARLVYLEHNNFIKVYLYDLLYVFIFIIFSVGFLLIGLFNTKKTLKSFPKELHIFLIPGLVITTILGLFYIQSAGGANSFQFTISIYIIGSIYAALALNRFSKSSNKIILLIVGLALMFSFTRVVGTSFNNLNKITDNSNSFKVSNNYLESLDYINKFSDKSDIVLTDPALGRGKCLFVKLVADKTTYYCEAAGPGDKGLIDVDERRNTMNTIFYGENSDKAINKIRLNNIVFILATKSAKLDNYEEVFSNIDYKILKTK